MDLTNLTNEQKLLLLEQLKHQKNKLIENLNILKDSDPFWFFEPSDGSLSEEAKDFIKNYLKPEDLPAQFDGIDKVIKSTAPIVVLSGGNQLGKTTLNAVLSHMKVTGETPKSLQGLIDTSKLPKKWPVYGRVYGLSNDVIEEVLVPKFRDWMPRKYMKEGQWEKSYSKQDKILRYYKDGKWIGNVKFMSCDKEVAKTQGVTLDFAHFDEEPPKEFYDELLPRFSASKRGIDIGFFFTPTNGLTWTYDTLIQGSIEPNSKIECFKISTVTNKYVNIDVLKQMSKDCNSYDELKMRILGEYVSLSGLIYTGKAAFNKDIHLIPPFVPDYYTYCCFRGLDPHISKPTACVELLVDRLGNRIVSGVYEETADLEQVKRDLAQRAIERNYRLAWTAYDKSLDFEIKAAQNLNLIDILKRPPSQIPAMLPSQKFDGSIKAGVDAIKQDLKPDPFNKKPKLFFMDKPEVWKLIKDIQTLERDKAHNEYKKGQRDKILEGRKDRHAALRYIYQQHLEWIPPDSGGPLEYKDPYEESYL